MCSVIGCESSGTAQRFKLPEDPDKRLEWVQFLAKINGQNFKESSWTDISICRDHFTDDCFENSSLVQLGFARALQLQSGAIPSLGPKLHGPKATLTSSKNEEETTNVGWQLHTCNHPKESLLNSKACQVTPVLSGVSVSCSTDVSYAVTFGTGQVQQKVVTQDLNKEKCALLQMKGKYVVNESCLLQLFRRNCPSCGSKCTLEKIIHGTLVIMNQQCRQCEYRNQWKSQAKASLPTAEGQPLTGGTELSTKTQQEMPSDDAHDCSSIPGVVSEIITFSDEESDSSDEDGEKSEGGDRDYSSDWDWNPSVHPDSLSEKNESGSDEERCEDDSPVGLKLNQLCPECGKFFNILKPHTCEYKIKPYSCNVCGKRCVSENSLKTHSNIHREDYEHRCKFCLTTFKTRLDKLTHEQTHTARKKPFQCPDCSETFANSKTRNKHLQRHRGPKRYTCKDCNMEFTYIHQLRRHSVVHTGVKPFVCDVCQRSFNQPGHLKSHMRLHTGERPYKCQHCDKSFNHNVSLKSHVQRFHGQVHSSGPKGQMEKINVHLSEAVKDEMNEVELDTGDAQEKGRKRGRDPGFDDVEEEEEEEDEEEDEEEEEEVEEEEEEEEEERVGTTKCKKRSTGRPVGRPKRNTGLVLPTQAEAHSPTTEAETFEIEHSKGTTGDKSEGGQSNSDPAFDPTEENEMKRSKRTRSTGRPRGRPAISEVEENSDSDSDFDPAEKRKKKNTGTRRGRPKKNPAV